MIKRSGASKAQENPDLRVRASIRHGMSLVEILLTMSILSGLIVAMLNLQLGAQRRFLTSETHLNAAVVAQMVMERLKSDITINPGRIRELTDSQGGDVWQFEGNVVDSSASADTSLPVSPIFEYLFAKDSSLYSDANRVSIQKPASTDTPAEAEMAHLVESFRDFRVAIRIENDVALEEDSTTSPLRELVKVITVTVSRTSRLDDKGVDPQAYRVSTRIVTPQDSLSTEALAALNKNFEGAGLEKAWQEFFSTLGADNKYFKEDILSLEFKRVLADCWIILGMINTEAYMVDGQTVAGTVVLRESMPTKSLNGWINILTDPAADYMRYAVFKKEVAKLQTLRMKIQFDTFKGVQPVLNHMYEEHRRILPQVDEVMTLLRTAQNGIIRLNSESEGALKDFQKERDVLKEAEEEAEVAQTEIDEGEALLVSSRALDSEALSLEEEARILKEEADALEASDGDPILIAEKRRVAAEKLELQRKKEEDAKKDRDKGTEMKGKGEEKKREADEKRRKSEEILAEARKLLEKDNKEFAALLTTAGHSLFEAIELVTVCKFLYDFFGEASFRTITDRMNSYPLSMRAGIDSVMTNLKAHIDQTDQTTPYEQVISAQRLVEMIMLHQLERGSADQNELDQLKSLGDRFQGTLKPLHSYLTGGPVHDFTKLQERNAAFRTRLRQLKDSVDPDNPSSLYLKVVENYNANGKMKQFIELYTEVASTIKLGGDSILVQLQNELMTLQNQLDYVTDATADEILDALSGP